MQGKMSEKENHAQDGPHFDIKPEFFSKMHQVAVERVQIFKIFPGKNAGPSTERGLRPILTHYNQRYLLGPFTSKFVPTG